MERDGRDVLGPFPQRGQVDEAEGDAVVDELDQMIDGDEPVAKVLEQLREMRA